MSELFTATDQPYWRAAIAIMLFAAIGMLIAVGLHVTSKFRDVKGHDRVTTNELLTKFREMHSEGELTEEEFRTIKTKLAPDLKRELKDSDEKG